MRPVIQPPKKLLQLLFALRHPLVQQKLSKKILLKKLPYLKMTSFDITAKKETILDLVTFKIRFII